MNVSQSPQLNSSKYSSPKTIDFRVKYKTQKCRYWEQQRYCPFGQMCAFAHDQFQMRFKGSIHQHYKTKPCLNFSKYDYCKYGDRCLFLHTTHQRDRDRTRSNSPTEQPIQFKVSNKHQQNLKILAEFGFEVFKVYCNRNHSKILKTTYNDQCNRTSISTQPQNTTIDIYDQKYFDDNVDTRQRAISEHKKTRMYSI